MRQKKAKLELLLVFALLLPVLHPAAVLTLPMLRPDITAFQRWMASGSVRSVVTVKTEHTHTLTNAQTKRFIVLEVEICHQ